MIPQTPLQSGIQRMPPTPPLPPPPPDPERGSHAPGAVGDLHAGALALPAATPGGRAVAGAGATEAGSHGATVRVRAGRPRGPGAEVAVHGEIPRLGRRRRGGCQAGLRPRASRGKTIGLARDDRTHLEEFMSQPKGRMGTYFKIKQPRSLVEIMMEEVGGGGEEESEEKKEEEGKGGEREGGKVKGTNSSTSGRWP